MRRIHAAIATALTVVVVQSSFAGSHTYLSGDGEPGTAWVYLHYDSLKGKYVIDSIFSSRNWEFEKNPPRESEIITVSPHYDYVRPKFSSIYIFNLDVGLPDTFPDKSPAYYYPRIRPFICPRDKKIVSDDWYDPCRSRFITPNNKYPPEVLGNNYQNHYVAEFDEAEFAKALRDTDLIVKVMSSRQPVKPERISSVSGKPTRPASGK